MSHPTTIPTLGGHGAQGAIITPEAVSEDYYHDRTPSSNEKIDHESDLGEKGGVYTEEKDVLPQSEAEAAILVNDGQPFPVDPHAPVEGNQLTVRALVVGCALGFVVGASNVYLGLKTGFTFGATLFGSILGFAILKPLSTILPEKYGGGYFGPKENVTVQSAAGAAGGLSGLFVAAVPAMYQLDLLSTPENDVGDLICLSFFTAFYGLIFAMPLRKYYIIRQKLVFPSPTATAFTIRSLHSAATPSARKASAKKIKILTWSFVLSLLWVVLSKYAPGVLWDWHLGWFFYQWGDYSNGAIQIENWGWLYEWTPAFHAVGFLTGPNAAFSWLFGAILAYGVIGPILVANGQAYSPFIDPETYPNWRSNFGMSSINLPDGTTDASRGSARYWLLWPGVLIMLVASFTELALQTPMIYRAFRGIVNEARKTIGERRGKDMSHIKNSVPDGIEDPAPPEEQVLTVTWVTGLIIAIVTTMILAKTQFGLNPGVTLLALILGFVFAFVGVQSSGSTDVNPIGTIAKAGQLIIGGVTKGQGVDIAHAQRTNLIAGSIVGQSAAHAVDCVGDLKTGHLIGAAPNVQFWAQLAGSLTGFSFAAGLFLLFAKAYPCITNLDTTGTQTCAFGLPAVSAWRAVAIAVTSPTLPVTLSSGMTAIGLSIVAALSHIARHFVKPKYAQWIPNWSAVGLAFVVPQVYYAVSMCVGSIIAMVWERRSPKSWEVWGFALSAGLIAGEGIGGVVTAVLVIAGVDGSVYGSAVGCPANEYCG